MAKPKLALIPAAQGSRFYSVLPSDGVGDFNFARASAATRINKYGLIETVAISQSRLNYPLIDGVVKGCPHHLLEPQRTNLVTYSEAFDNAYWTKSGSSVTSGFISPDGTANAFKLVEGAANSQHYISRNITTGGSSYVSSSIYFKANGRTKARVYVSDNATGQVAVDVDLFAGTINIPNITDGSWTDKSATITKMADNWYRVSITGLQGAGTIAVARVYLLDDTGNTSYTGDGASGIYIWGAQLELGSYPTSYIVSNSGSATTRVAETANGAGDASTFNDSEGVLMAEISALADDLNIEGISVSDGSSSNRVVIFKWNVSNTIKIRVASSGTNYVNENLTLSDVTDVIKIAVKYKQNDFSIFINGFELFSENTGLTPIGLDSLEFNSDGIGGSPFYGKTKQLQYFDSALTDSELETLTSWVSFQDMAEGQLYTIE